MFDELVTIESNEKVNEKYFKLVFSSERLTSGVLPGQFVNVLIEEGVDPFLRRPFSYYRVEQSRVEILYEILGKGTGLLSKKRAGASIKILGPLGKPFTAEIKSRKKVMVAGGIGLPPLVFLAERSGADYFLIGAKSRSEVLPESELTSIKGEVRYATNDGTYGTKGFVTVLLKQVIEELGADSIFVQTCGPKVMMQAVIDMAREAGVPGEASIDENMACGVGACLGCMVRTPKGLVPSCVEGPVFNFEHICQSLVEVNS